MSSEKRAWQGYLHKVSLSFSVQRYFRRVELLPLWEICLYIHVNRVKLFRFPLETFNYVPESNDSLPTRRRLGIFTSSFLIGMESPSLSAPLAVTLIYLSSIYLANTAFFPMELGGLGWAGRSNVMGVLNSKLSKSKWTCYFLTK